MTVLRVLESRPLRHLNDRENNDKVYVCTICRKTWNFISAFCCRIICYFVPYHISYRFVHKYSDLLYSQRLIFAIWLFICVFGFGKYFLVHMQYDTLNILNKIPPYYKESTQRLKPTYPFWSLYNCWVMVGLHNLYVCKHKYRFITVKDFSVLKTNSNKLRCT